MLIGLVHRLIDETELDHRTVILDESRVRGSARGRERRRAAGHVGDGGAHEVDERARRGDEHVGVRRLPFDAPADALAGRPLRATLDQEAADRIREALRKAVNEQKSK